MAATNAPSTTKETERKYELAEKVRLPDPERLVGRGKPAVTGERQPEDQQLDAVYFDTAALALAQAGITLRRREGGSDAGWHLKLPSGVDSRDELRLPLGRARRTPPAELTALTRVHTRGEALKPVVRLRTRRRRWLLADGTGQALAELAEDRVTAHTLGHGTEATHWREVEVELTEHGSVDLLDRIEKRLLKAGAERSSSSSKLDRVLADRIPDGPGHRDDADSAGAVVIDYLRAQVDTLRRYDPAVRQDAPDSVHKMRVSSRRLRSAMQAYRRVLDRDATRPLTDELKWLAGELAPARDTEVMAARFGGVVDQLPAQLVLGPVAGTLDRTFGRQQAQGRERAVAALDSARYLALQDALDGLLTDPPLTEKADRPADRELPASVRRAHRRLRRRMAAADEQPAGPDRDGALHEARKAAKRLRYATEVAEPAIGEPARRLRKRLKKMQSVLGDHQDTVVARPVLRDLGAQVHLDGGNGFTFGLLHGIEATRAERAERELPGRWARLEQPKITRWLRG
ncbi:MAG TPA: CYTH and CHAD domain-containing protein [Pseudonocardia sp.]|nr:CYTH and CHAD domain-containing protein [Pseudonocardia sp.]